MKNPSRLYTLRAGSGTLGGVLLGIGALVAGCVAAYAMWTLVQLPTPGTEDPESREVNPLELQGIAATETIEEILGAVQVYVRNEQFGQATTVLEHAARQYPGDQELHLALGDLYMLQKMYEDAYGQYVAGIEIGPSTATAEFTAGTLANMLDRLELSQAHYAAAMRLDPKNPDTPIYLAAIQIKMNRLTDAKKNLAVAGLMAPERSRIYAMRSEIAMRENNLVIALEQIHKAIDINPREIAWLLQEARVLKRSGKAEEAINLLASLTDQELEQPEAAYILADCYGMLGRPGDAASRLMDLAEKKPQDARLAFDIALWLERADERSVAIEWANKAIALGHERAQAWIESLP